MPIADEDIERLARILARQVGDENQAIPASWNAEESLTERRKSGGGASPSGIIVVPRWRVFRYAAEKLLLQREALAEFDAST